MINQRTKSFNVLALCLLSLIFGAQHALCTPKLTVIIIADQFAYHYIERLRPHFKYGIKELLDYGVCYENAYHPHGNPETTPGHHAISTGTLPKDHGIVSNQWLDENGTQVAYTQPDQTLVDGLSDQFVLKSTKSCTHHVLSFSLKQRSAIATANKLGGALWLDNKNGHFTSSETYFKRLPAWLVNFNKKQTLKP